MVQVRVKEGILEGEVINNEYGGKFYSFKGIPYAQPPVGDLRFKAPQPPRPWTGVRDATKLGEECYHFDPFFGTPTQGSEDCLYLNVYSPNVSPPKPLPVMVWIHGGGFVCGSSSDDLYGPQFLVRHDVILVTINYRLEVLGFLCLETAEVPGNAGMKDQVAALRWVRTNIASFGGDPDNVTIFGESAGGASVSLHLLSPMSKGLFKRAISQSGTSACAWATTTMVKERSLQMARAMGCNSKDEKEVYEFLKVQPVEAFVDRRIKLTYAEANKEAGFIYFNVVEEKQFGDNERFMPAAPIDLLRAGIHEGVEVINGYTEDEGILMLSIGLDIQKILEQANNYPEYFVPIPIVNSCKITDQIEAGKTMKAYYFKDEEVSMNKVDRLYGFLGADSFIYPAILWQKLCAKNGSNKTYLYKFTCKSERNILKHLLGVGHVVGDKDVVCHADDLPYLFPMKFFTQNSPKLDTNSTIYKMIDQFTKLWTNFAKYGNPTPDASLGAIWKPYTLDNQDFLDIGEHLVAGTSPDNDEMQFWERIYQKYCSKYAP
ncbi:juvenile hormone esterase [Papilio machaon]|uniref:juvenile hormone esterase n=1 Tax=Papilio machaon TaxID=76193 RepID=UPI001E6656A7|nr:juvenile hormone esterase [Papilio machaon]